MQRTSDTVEGAWTALKSLLIGTQPNDRRGLAKGRNKCPQIVIAGRVLCDDDYVMEHRRN